MSGCHNPNVCYHVDGEFCDRCYKPEQSKNNLEEIKVYLENKLKELRTNLEEVTQWCCRIECDFHEYKAKGKLNAALPSIGELNAIVRRELNDSTSAAFWFNQADKFKNENIALRKYVKEKEVKFQTLSKEYGERGRRLEQAIMDLCVKQQQHRDACSEITALKVRLRKYEDQA